MAGRTIEAVLADLEEVAANFDKGWRAEPPTMAALIRRVKRDIEAALGKRTQRNGHEQRN